MDQKNFLILASDPGSVNYGISSILGTITNGQITNIEVLQVGLQYTTVKELKGKISISVQSYLNTVKEVYEKYTTPGAKTRVILERYMTRGIKGTTIESVNIMIGASLCWFYTKGVPGRIIPASQWKNAIARAGIDLSFLYQEAKKTLGLPPHPVDAMCLGIYYLYMMTNTPPFHGLNHEILMFMLSNADKENFGEKPKKVPKKSKRREP